MAFRDDAQGWLDPRAQLLGQMDPGYSPFSMVSQNPYAQYGVPVPTLQQPTVGMPQMQPIQVPVNPQNVWSLFSGSTNPYTSVGPSEGYQRQRALEREGDRFGQGLVDDQSYVSRELPYPDPSLLTESGWGHLEPGFDPTGTRQGGVRTQPDLQKRLPPKRQRREAEVGRGRGGIEEWPEGRFKPELAFNLPAPRYLINQIKMEIDEYEGSPRYNQHLASPKNPKTVGDWMAKWLIETGGHNTQGKFEKNNPEPGAQTRSENRHRESVLKEMGGGVSPGVGIGKENEYDHEYINRMWNHLIRKIKKGRYGGFTSGPGGYGNAP